MSYYQRRYRKYKNNYDRDEFNLIDEFFEILLQIISYLSIWLVKLILKLAKRIFQKGTDTVNSFKINDDISYAVQVNKNTDTIPGKETSTATKTIQNLVNQEGSNYETKDLLTPAESKFLFVLEQAVGGRYEIGKQVQLSRIVTPKDSDKNFTSYHYFNKIKAKSIDFVLFDKTKNYKPYLCIELDDRSHLRWDRIKRDDFVNEIMKNVGIRIIHIPVRYFYDIEKLKRQIFSDQNIK